MYENYKLCDDLTAETTCIVVEQYDAGTFVRRYHEHVPARSLTQDGRVGLGRSLVLHFMGVGPEKIVREHLRQKRRPGRGDLDWVVEYPEPGVIRYYCGINTKAWFDVVIRRDEFRSGSSEPVSPATRHI